MIKRAPLWAGERLLRLAEGLICEDSDMESQGEPGMVQITRATYELIKDEFVCVPSGTLDVKGRGEMETWFLEGRATDNGDKS
jgi:hypothetical protein